MVRRAEWALGKAIRAGQERGEIASRGDNLHTRRLDHGDTELKARVTEFATYDELSGNNGSAGIYSMTDGVTEPEFEAALKEARAEGNVSRANVVRKVGDNCRTDMKDPVALCNSMSSPTKFAPKYELTNTHGLCCSC